MFTILIYSTVLASPDSFWNSTHLTSLWVIAILLDLMLLLVVLVGLNAMMALGDGDRSSAARRRLEGIARRLLAVDRAVLILGGVMLAGLVCVTFFSVLGRTFIAPIPDDITFSEWFLVALVATMLGTIQGREDHIEVTVIADNASHRVNLYFRLLGVAIGVLAVGRLAYVAFLEVPDSFIEITYGSIYELPAWPPRVAFLLGVAWWLTRIAVQALLLPILVADDARGRSARFGAYPLITYAGRGTEESEALDPGPESEQGGARGT